MWRKVSGQDSVLPDGDKQHVQSCASLSPLCSCGHIPGYKYEYINNIKPYFDQNPNVSLASAAPCLVQKSCQSAARQGTLCALSGKDFSKVALGYIMLVSGIPFYPHPKHQWYLVLRWKQPPLSSVPCCQRDGPSHVPQRYTGCELVCLDKVFCLVILITCSNIYYIF